MKTAQFLKQRKDLQKKLGAFKKNINKEYAKITKSYVLANSPVKEKKVYELVENGIKRRGFKRFVVYTHDINIVIGHVKIRVGGWWLDEDSVPSKWDNMTVTGISNAAVFVLSKNQVNKPHPEKNKK